MHASQQTNEERLAQDLSRRKHFRLECQVTAQFSCEVDGAEQVENFVVRNIGFGGARVDSPIDLPMPCELTLTLPEISASEGIGQMQLQCRVAWTVADRGTGPFPTGLQILGLDEPARKQLFRYLAALMR